MTRKLVLVWGKVMTVDYYGSFESIVAKSHDIPHHSLHKNNVGGKGVGWIHDASQAGKLKHVKAICLKTGVWIKVQWPNKHVTLERIVNVNGNDSARIDMNGGSDHFPTRHLVIQRDYNGAKSNVPLMGRKIGVYL
jgi:hypothetical protein